MPYEFTCVDDIKDTAADMVLNGHYHSDPWTYIYPAETGEKFIINAGSVGRTAKDDKHEVSVLLITIDQDSREQKVERIKLTNVKSHDDAFLVEEEVVRPDDDESIKEFAKALQANKEGLEDEDLISVVKTVCKGRPKEVTAGVLRRLEL